jgi:hypothetical protein
LVPADGNENGDGTTSQVTPVSTEESWIKKNVILVSVLSAVGVIMIGGGITAFVKRDIIKEKCCANYGNEGRPNNNTKLQSELEVVKIPEKSNKSRSSKKSGTHNPKHKPRNDDSSDDETRQKLQVEQLVSSPKRQTSEERGVEQMSIDSGDLAGVPKETKYTKVVFATTDGAGGGEKHSNLSFTETSSYAIPYFRRMPRMSLTEWQRLIW